MFENHYQPSSGAIKRFLEHRQLDPTPEDRERIYADASRPRQVAIFIKLGDDDTPVPVARGSVFAFLPTGVTLPIGVHIQADWLLVISRQEIMQMEGNEWHKCILRQIPRLLRYYLAWVVSDQCGGNWEKGYDALPGSYRADNELDRWFESSEFRDSLTQEINDLEFLPVPSLDESVIEFRAPSNSRTLPRPLAETFDKPQMKLQLLFGDQIISTWFLGERGAQFILDLRLISELNSEELALTWDQGAVAEWIEQFDESDRDKLLAELLGSLAELDAEDIWKEAELLCLPTESGGWTDRTRLNRFPAEWNVFAQEHEIRSALESFLGPKDAILLLSFDSYIAKFRSPALRFLERVTPPRLDEIVKLWWESFSEELDAGQIELVIRFTSWVRSKQPQRKSLVRKVLCEGLGGTLQLLPASETMLADPYAGAFRRSFFAQYAGRCFRLPQPS